MVLVWVDHDRGRVDELSLQAVTFARVLAAASNEELDALVVGVGGTAAAEVLGEYGVRAVHSATHPQLQGYAPLATARALAEILSADSPSAVVAIGSDRGNEVMAHLAAVTDLPLAADCLEVAAGEPARVKRSRWGGSLYEEAEVRAPTTLLTLAPHSTEAVSAGGSAASIREFTPALSDADLLVQAKAESSEETAGVTLADAKVVVSGGRGVGGAEGFAVLEELAELLNGAVGCSRVVTSAGWRPHTDQVGQTGTKVAPDLYIACGISGATQHLAGCRTSKTMLVINNDPEASILAHADYAVIGDLHTILPAIVAETRKAKSA
ncbi:MAG TPA: electron transfer flavoprotein subunit alpha/FixB family protein [Actinomycetes bacterium]|nr:electron transfer flavoprotein subunit alpha/FixB family protein [Actinomycetes bacterium]